MSFPKYPAYKDSGVEWIGKVPVGWSVKPFWTLFRRVKRNDHAEKELLSIYRDYGVIPKSSRNDNFNKPSDDLAAYQLVKKNDLVINKMKAWQGSCAVSDFEGIVSPAYFVFSSTSNNFGKFLHYLLRCDLYISYYYYISKGVRPNQWDLDPETHSRMPVILPSLPEQQAIATFLDRECGKIDALIAEQERLIALLAEKRQAVISHAVTKGLNPNAPMKESGIEWIGKIPVGWDAKPLKRFCTVSRGASPRPIDDEKYFDDEGEFSWIRISDVTTSQGSLKKTEQKLSQLGSSLSVKIYPGDLFLSIAGSVGKVCISEIKACIHDGFVYFKNLKLNEKFVFWIFEAGLCFGGLGKMGTQLNLNTDTVGNIFIPLPQFSEQQAIANFLDQKCSKIAALIAAQERLIALCKERRAALISAAVTGKIDVRAHSKAIAA